LITATAVSLRKEEREKDYPRGMVVGTRHAEQGKKHQRIRVKGQATGFESLVEKDKRLSREVYDRFYERVVPASVLELIEGLGSGKIWFPLAIAALVATRDNLPSAQIAANFVAGLVLDVIIVGSLKAVVRRDRPDYSRSKEYVPVINVDSYSMPSGHTSRSVYVAIFFSCVITTTTTTVPLHAVAMTCLGVVWSVGTAASRVMLGRHYLLDVFVGTAVSFLNFLMLTKGTFSATGLLLDTHLTSQLVQKFSL
jgi:membrane-associated phospholipid phosphatase